MVSPEVKRPGLEPDHSSPSSFKIKNEWSCAYISASVFMASAGTNLSLRWQPYFVSDRTWLRFSNRRQIFLTSSSCCCGDPMQKLSYNLQLARMLYHLSVLSFTVTLQSVPRDSRWRSATSFSD